MGDIHPYLGGLLLLAFIIIDAVLYAFSSALQNVNDSFIEKSVRMRMTGRQRSLNALRIILLYCQMRLI